MCKNEPWTQNVRENLKRLTMDLVLTENTEKRPFLCNVKKWKTVRKRVFQRKHPQKGKFIGGKCTFSVGKFAWLLFFWPPKIGFRPKITFLIWEPNFCQRGYFATFREKKTNMARAKISSPGSVCPSPSPPTPGQPCTLPGELDCHYQHEPEHDCCGNCQNFTLSCVPDNSTTGAGLWQMSSPPCPVDCCGSKGATGDYT